MALYGGRGESTKPSFTEDNIAQSLHYAKSKVIKITNDFNIRGSDHVVRYGLDGGRMESTT